MATDRATLQSLCVQFQKILKAEGHDDLGFAVLVFDKDSGGYMGWASNCKRQSMLTAMGEFIEKNGGTDVNQH